MIPSKGNHKIRSVLPYAAVPLQAMPGTRASYSVQAGMLIGFNKKDLLVIKKRNPIKTMPRSHTLQKSAA